MHVLYFNIVDFRKLLSGLGIFMLHHLAEELKFRAYQDDIPFYDAFADSITIDEDKGLLTIDFPLLYHIEFGIEPTDAELQAFANWVKSKTGRTPTPAELEQIRAYCSIPHSLLRSPFYYVLDIATSGTAYRHIPDNQNAD